jgi:hypothetical protein
MKKKRPAIVSGNGAVVMVARSALINIIRDAAKTTRLDRFVDARDLTMAIVEQIAPWIERSKNTVGHIAGTTAGEGCGWRPVQWPGSRQKVHQLL